MIYLLSELIIESAFTFFIICLIAILFKNAFSSFTSLEVPPKILPITPEKKRTFGESAANVQVGLYIHDFPDFNILEGTFSLDGTVWFEFNPSQVSLDDLEKFSFFEGNIDYKSVAQIKKIRNKIFVAYNFKVTFTSLLNYKQFPFDDHRIFLILKNEALSARELQFSALKGGIAVTDELSPHGWKLKKTNVEVGLIKAQFEKGDSKKTMLVPVSVFEFDFEKPSFNHTVLMFVPIFLLFYLSLYSLVFDVQLSLDTALVSVSSLIVYRFVLESMSPKTGYSTIIDNFFIFILSCSFLVFAYHIYQIEIKSIGILGITLFYSLQIAVALMIWSLLRKRNNKRKIDFFYFPKFIRREKKGSFPRLFKLNVFKKIADSFEEFPQKMDGDHLFEDYNMTLFEKKTRGLSQISKKILNVFGLDIEEFSPSYFKKIIEAHLNMRESKDLNYHHILLHPLKKGEKYYIWGDIQGAFHSLVRTLEDLEKKGVINRDLQIMNSDHYFVFNGNLIGPSPYNLETLSLVITLMLKNPDNVIYLKGPHEEKRFWSNLALRNELEILARGGSSEIEPFESTISGFFLTLPHTIYLGEINQGVDNFIMISPRSPHLINYSKHLHKSLHNQSSRSFDPIRLTNRRSNEALPLILARLKGLVDDAHYRRMRGVDLLPPEEGATHWSIFSSPLEVHRDYYNFNLDAYAVLEVDTHISRSTLKRCTRKLDKETHFHEKSFDLLSGQSLEPDFQHIGDFKPKDEVRIGSTLDLTETSSILGERLRRGLDLRIRKANKEGGVKGGFLRLFFANDKYTPSLTLQNVQRFIAEDKITLILSPLGTPTTKALIHLSDEGKILVLFPYSGGNIFRNPNLKNFINYRASYAEEAAALVRYAKEFLFSQRFAFFFQDDDYGHAPLNAAKKILLEEYNISEDAICEASYQRNTVLVESAAMKIEQFSPDVIFFFSTYPPSRALLEKIGVQKLSNVNLMGISFLTDRFQEYASGILDPEQQGKGLNFIISRVVPNPENSTIDIVKDYQVEMAREYPDVRLDVDSLEGYINASILLYLLESIERPYTHEKVLQAARKINHLNFKGLILNFDPQAQSLSKNVWLDLGDGDWI